MDGGKRDEQGGGVMTEQQMKAQIEHLTGMIHRLCDELDHERALYGDAPRAKEIDNLIGEAGELLGHPRLVDVDVDELEGVG